VRVAGIARDVTEAVRGIEQLQLAQHKLQLLGSLTNHDLRNHIAAAAGYLDLALRSGDEIKKAEFMAKGRSSLIGMDALLDATRKYYELGQVPPTWLDLRGVVEWALSSPEFNHLDVRLELPGVEVYADELLLQVFHNLLHNTVKHGQGTIEVRIRADETVEGLLIAYEDNGARGADGGQEGHIRMELLLTSRAWPALRGRGARRHRDDHKGDRRAGVQGVPIRDRGAPERVPLQGPVGTFASINS